MKDELFGNTAAPCLNCLPQCRQGGLLGSQPAADCMTQYPPGKAIHHEGEVVKTVIDFIIGDVRTPGFIEATKGKIIEQIIKAHYPGAVSGSEWISLSMLKPFFLHMLLFVH